MSRAATHDVTDLLVRWQDGDRAALDAFVPLVYAELRRIASAELRRERSGHTLQTTALAHEAFLRLADQKRITWEGRAHFLGVAAVAMRRILIDHARRKRAKKRGGGAVKVEIDLDLLPGSSDGVDLEALDHALNALAVIDTRQARVVELRFFGGLSLDEAAAVLEVSTSTIKRDWTVARAWLYRELRGESGPA